MTVDESAAVGIVNDWVLCSLTGDPQATVGNLLRVLRDNDDELDELRSRLSGWHFAKEALTDGAREILEIAEELMRLLDGDATQ